MDSVPDKGGQKNAHAVRSTVQRQAKYKKKWECSLVGLKVGEPLVNILGVGEMLCLASTNGSWSNSGIMVWH